MKKFIIALALFLLPGLALANQSPTASQVATNCSTWSKNLNCTMTNQQLVDNAVDQFSGGGGGGNPGGSNTQIQYNNNGIFAGGTMYYVNSNVGIGSTIPGTTLDVTGTIRAINFVGTAAGTSGQFQYNNGTNNSMAAKNILYTDGTNVLSSTLQGTAELNTVTGGLSVPGSIQSTGPGGYIEYPQVPVPSNPASGYDRFFFQNGDVPSYQTSSGQTITLGSGGSGTVTSVGINSPNNTISTTSSPITTSGIIGQDINWTNVNGIAAINVGGVNWNNITSYASGKVLTATTAGGVNWNTVTGTGTVTSVGLSSPNTTLIVGSTPVTAAGTITADINWTDVNKISEVASGGINWNDVNKYALMNYTAVNWNSVNGASQINSAGLNWNDLNRLALLNNTGINWQSMYAQATTINWSDAQSMLGLDVLGTVQATSFSGAGTGLTGTASSLSIGGNAATATTATNFSGSLSGDVTGTQSSTSVVKVNGAAVPASKTIVGTNSSNQIIDASSATLANNTTGQSGTVATINGLITNGSNVTITGSGTSGSPYTIASTAGGTGTVTSVGINSPNSTIVTTSSPVTTSGTIGQDINWTDVNGIASINTGGLNWASINSIAKLNSSGVNWNDINAHALLNNTGINWQSMYAQTSTINWTDAQSMLGLDVLGTVQATSFSGAGTGLTGTASSLSIGGNSATTTALGSTPTLCSSGQGATGINTSGNAQGCTTYLTSNQTVTLTGAVTGSGATSIATTLANTIVQNANVNWNSLNASSSLNTGAVNWNDINAHALLNNTGVNWQSMYNQTTTVNWSAAMSMPGLDVFGTVQAQQLTDTGITASKIVKTTAGQQLTAATGDTDYQNPIILTTTGSSGAATFTGDTLNIPQYSGGGGSNYWVNDSGNVGINTTYNVGIGTISQVNTLNIAGNIGIGTTLASDLYTHTAAPTGGLIVYGNVGIGSLTPGELLDVYGTARILGTNGSLSIGTANVPPANGLMVFGNVSIGTGTTSSNALTVYKPSANSNVSIGTTATASSMLAVGTSGQFTVGSTGAIGTSNSYTQSGSGLNEFTGNLGLGSALPGSVLDVNGTARIFGNIGIGTANPGVAIDTNGTIRTTATGGVGIGTTNPTGALEIEGGNVGIGTNLGGALLTLGGNAAASGSATVGPVICLGVSTNGVACLGKCTSISTDTCACTCL